MRMGSKDIYFSGLVKGHNSIVNIKSHGLTLGTTLIPAL